VEVVEEEEEEEVEEVEEEEVVEEEVEVEEVEEEEVVEEEEEVEVEYMEVDIKGVSYCTDDDKNGKIYTMTEEGDLGEEVGVFKNGKAIMTKK
jgi:hypothetical protein